jgi:hypothetical protein
MKRKAPHLAGQMAFDFSGMPVRPPPGMSRLDPTKPRKPYPTAAALAMARAFQRIGEERGDPDMVEEGKLLEQHAMEAIKRGSPVPPDDLVDPPRPALVPARQGDLFDPPQPDLFDRL